MIITVKIFNIKKKTLLATTINGVKNRNDPGSNILNQPNNEDIQQVNPILCFFLAYPFQDSQHPNHHENVYYTMLSLRSAPPNLSNLTDDNIS